jgi:hypothetical protein
MAEKVNWTPNIQVANGPKVAAADSMDVEANDKVEVSISDGATDQEV